MAITKTLLPQTVITRDLPKGYIPVEDMIACMERVQRLQVTAKQNQLDIYGGADYASALKAMNEQITLDITEITTYMKSELEK